MKSKHTVATLIAELKSMPQDLPVVVSCHYDNDDGLRWEGDVRLALVRPDEAEYVSDSVDGWDDSEPVVIIS